MMLRDANDAVHASEASDADVDDCRWQHADQNGSR